MSFLSILLFSTAFYFAYGRPDTGAVPESDPPPVSNDDYTTTLEPEHSQEQMDIFIQEISDAIDKYLSPMMSGIDEDTQNEMKSMLLNAYSSYMNYAIITMKQNQTDDGTENGISQFLSGRDDITIEFKSLGPLERNTGLIPAFQDSSLIETNVKVIDEDEGYEEETSSMAEAEVGTA